MITKFEQITSTAQRCTEELYWDALEVVPPIYAAGCFGLGEALRHTEDGEVVTYWFGGKPSEAWAMIGTHREALAEFAKVRAARVEAAL